MLDTKQIVHFQKGEFTKLQIEPINPDSKYLAAMVTSVQSPELFCVTVLNNANIRVLNVSIILRNR